MAGASGVTHALAALLVLVYTREVLWQAAAATKAGDVAALKGVLAGFGSSGKILQWIGDDPCGSKWTGVNCDGPNVINLYLYRSGLRGQLSPAIGDLVDLQNLEMSYNREITGNLPKELGNLQQLTSLSLQQCGFTGQLPAELGNLSKLTVLSVNNNYLQGTIPGALGQLSQMYWFDLSSNQFSGPLPVSTSSEQNVGLDNLTSTGHFHFQGNKFNGPIPPEIFSLPKLVHLLLDHNDFGGPLPRQISNAPSLGIFKVDNNQLNGQLPSQMGQMSQLTELYLGNNQFQGTLPDLSNLTKLAILDLSYNSFQPQPISDWMPQLSTLLTLLMDRSNLIGEVPPSILEIPLLQKLSLRTNSLNGTLTFGPTVSPSLEIIDLEQNTITDVAGQPSNPQASLLLAGNPVCSDNSYVPTSPSVCQMQNGSLESWTPAALKSCNATCKSGKTLNPHQCSCAFPLLCTVELTAPAFSTIDQQRITGLEGEFATGLVLNKNQVYIGSAGFTNEGRILLSTLYFPDVGEDSLSPANTSRIISTLSVNARPGGGLGLSEGPFLLLSYTLPPTGESNKHSLSNAAVVGIVVGAIVIALVGAGIIVYALLQKRRADRAEVLSRPFASWGGGGGDSGDAPKLKGARWFSYSELKKSTNNFNQSNEIGFGGYGKVYKGILATGESVAIKRAHEGSMQGATEFKNEIELLSRVHHRNLVGLVGFCYEQGEQMLIYEYLPNGTLRQHLGQPERHLPWSTRMAIAVGSAKGIAYLHDLANPPIIHRDIKSSNILLDENLVAKVADFGLSKLAPDGDKNHVSTQVKGTLGYLDPEYYTTQQLSDKSDVYSFGVVLLELITARQPIERGRYIVREVRTVLERDGMAGFQGLLDPALGSDYPPQELERLLELALRCVEETAARRPNMNEVLKELESINGGSSSNPNSGGAARSSSTQKLADSYDEPQYVVGQHKGADPSFQYSGGFLVSPVVEPK